MDTYTPPPSEDILLAIRQSIGKRIELRRKAIGMSQETLGKRIGVSRAQMSLYERGASSITAERIHLICDVLHVDSGYVYDRLPQSTSTKYSRPRYHDKEAMLPNYFGLPWRHRMLVDSLISCLSNNRIPLRALEIEELDRDIREILG